MGGGRGEHRRPVLPALAVPHVDAIVIEIQLLDPQAERLRQPQPAAIQPLPYRQVGNESIRAGEEGREEVLHLGTGERRGDVWAGRHARGFAQALDLVRPPTPSPSG